MECHGLRSLLIFAGCLFAVISGCGGPPDQVPTAEPDLFSRQHVLDVMERTFDWQIDNIVYSAPLPDGGFQDVSDTEWVRGAFFAGVMAAYEATAVSKFLDAAVEISERNAWQPGPGPD